MFVLVISVIIYKSHAQQQFWCCEVSLKGKSNLDILFGKNRVRLMLLPVQIYRLCGMRSMGDEFKSRYEAKFFR